MDQDKTKGHLGRTEAEIDELLRPKEHYHKGRLRPHTPPYSWSEVIDVLDGTVTVENRDYWSEIPEASPEPCSECGQPMRWLKWRNSDQCWELDCGRAGWLPICEPCENWGRLIRTAMN